MKTKKRKQDRWARRAGHDMRPTVHLSVETAKAFSDICNAFRVPQTPMLEQILEQWMQSEYVKNRLKAIWATWKVLGEKEYREMKGSVSKKNLPEERWFICEDCENRRALRKRAV
jgi:hypothetical protein